MKDVGDYIEREAARNLICGFCLDCDGSTDVCEYRDIQVDRIPTAEVREVKRSHWFDGACANCGFKPALDLEYATVYDRRHGYAWNFCPNCGADMRDKEG